MNVYVLVNEWYDYSFHTGDQNVIGVYTTREKAITTRNRLEKEDKKYNSSNVQNWYKLFTYELC